MKGLTLEKQQIAHKRSDEKVTENVYIDISTDQPEVIMRVLEPYITTPVMITLGKRGDGTYGMCLASIVEELPISFN